MSIALNLTQTNIENALGSFLTAVLPIGTPIVVGQINRAAEPLGDFVVFWPIRRERIETNTDSWADCVFTASISGSTMTVTGVKFGTLTAGSTVFGSAGLQPNTTVTALGSGTGGPGTYVVNPPQSAPSQAMAAGGKKVLQPTHITFQVDVHGPNSADNAEIITTLFRDEFATTQFASSGFDVTPLHADDPRQVPFINDQNQYENRWVIEAHVQANQSVIVPQQYTDAVKVITIDVDAAYPS